MDQEAEVAATLFDLAGLFEKADTVLEVEEHRTAAPGKRNLRTRIAKPARLTDAHNATAAAGRNSRSREAVHTAQHSRAASQHDEKCHSAPAPPQDSDALVKLPNPWEHRSLQHLLPCGKPDPQLGMQPISSHLPPGLASFYQPPSPAVAAQMAAAQAAWPGMPAVGVGLPGEGVATVAGAAPVAVSTASAGKWGSDLSGFRRCASHVFIAHFIAEETKLERHRAQQAQQHAQQQAQAAKFGLNGMYQASRPPLNSTSSAAPMSEAGLLRAAVATPPGAGNPHPLAGLPMTMGNNGFPFQPPSSMGLPGHTAGGARPEGGSAAMNLPQHFSQLQFQAQMAQMAMLAGQAPGGFPMLPPGMGMGPGNPFAALTPQQMAAASPFLAQQQFGLPSMMPPGMQMPAYPMGSIRQLEGSSLADAAKGGLSLKREDTAGSAVLCNLPPFRPPSVNGHGPGHSVGPSSAAALQPLGMSFAPNGSSQPSAHVPASTDPTRGINPHPGLYPKPAGLRVSASAPAPERASPCRSSPTAPAAQGCVSLPANSAASTAGPPGPPSLRGAQLTPALMQAAAAAVVAGATSNGADPLAHTQDAEQHNVRSTAVSQPVVPAAR